MLFIVMCIPGNAFSLEPFPQPSFPVILVCVQPVPSKFVDCIDLLGTALVYFVDLLTDHLMCVSNMIIKIITICFHLLLEFLELWRAGADRGVTNGALQHKQQSVPVYYMYISQRFSIYTVSVLLTIYIKSKRTKFTVLNIYIYCSNFPNVFFLSFYISLIDTTFKASNEIEIDKTF